MRFENKETLKKFTEEYIVPCIKMEIKEKIEQIFKEHEQLLINKLSEKLPEIIGSTAFKVAILTANALGMTIDQSKFTIEFNLNELRMK